MNRNSNKNNSNRNHALQVMAGILTPGILSILLVACMTTDITKVKIRELKPVVTNSQGKAVSELAPASHYLLKISIESDDGEQITNPHYGAFVIEDTNQLFAEIKPGILGIELMTSPNLFLTLPAKEYAVRLSIRNNDFPGRAYTWPINWPGFNLWLDYSSHMEGQKGMDGTDGRDGSNTMESMVDGSDGGDGQNGWSGFRGKDARLLIVPYDVGDFIKDENILPFLLVVDLANKAAYLSPGCNIYISSRGSAGGDGGTGGSGGKGGKYNKKSPYDPAATTNALPPDPMNISEGEPGAPGSGGNGGDGGTGGSVQVLFYDEQILAKLIIDTAGGDGGQGGAVGKADFMAKGIAHAGRSGLPGGQGEIRREKVGYDDALSLIKSTGIGHIDLKRVLH